MISAKSLGLAVQTAEATQSVERTLCGCKPRSLAKRFRHLMKYVTEVPVTYLDHGQPTTVMVKTGRMGYAGHLRQLFIEATR